MQEQCNRNKPPLAVLRWNIDRYRTLACDLKWYVYAHLAYNAYIVTRHGTRDAEGKGDLDEVRVRLFLDAPHPSPAQLDLLSPAIIR